MTRIEQIRKKWRETQTIAGADVDFILKLSELPDVDGLHKKVKDDLYLAVCCGPLSGVEGRLSAAAERIIARVTAAVRGDDYKKVDEAASRGGET